MSLSIFSNWFARHIANKNAGSVVAFSFWIHAPTDPWWEKSKTRNFKL